MSLPITRLLVANRGEIARRIMRTADELGIETVAVFSDPDRGMPFVDEATYAVALGGTTSAESYLDAVKVLDAARRTGADAIHPGYGFLSENADFAQAVADAGLVWVGPTPSSMRAMALKVEAKRIAADAGVPLVPGADLAADVSEPDLLAIGDQVGYPLLVKASAGGGGKGMRIVRASGDLLEAVQGARREAAASSGDATVFFERYLERSRHVEVQVFGDTHGHVVHLFERECSIQRRHQKVVEESPSPGATSSTLDRMYAAALSLASAIGYVGAGTVEFLVAGEGDAQEFFFLEMNTRLQVEHPVTEMVTGLDLVQWQIAVAQGEPLPLAQNDIERSGHAIEVRVYAEDPANGYLPSTGTLRAWDLDRWHQGVRIDSAVEEESEVSSYYDPMLAKVIARGERRADVAAELARFLRGSMVSGVRTNSAMLAAVLESPGFLAGDTTTAFLEEHPELIGAAAPSDVFRRQALAAAAIVLGDVVPTRDLDLCETAPRAWRNVAGVPELVTLRLRNGTQQRTVVVAREWRRVGSTYLLGLDVEDASVAAQAIFGDERFERIDTLRLTTESFYGLVFAGMPARLEVDGIRATVHIAADDEARPASWLEQRPSEPHGPRELTVRSEGWTTDFEVVEPWASSAHEGSGAGPTTPVPGTVTHVAVAVGDEVEAGAALVVLEAMKMEHTIRADVAGTVTEIHVSVGQSVDAHTVVATVEAAS